MRAKVSEVINKVIDEAGYLLDEFLWRLPAVLGTIVLSALTAFPTTLIAEALVALPLRSLAETLRTTPAPAAINRHDD